MSGYKEMKERYAASRFRLTRAEKAYLAEKGRPVIRVQTERIIRERLAPASCPITADRHP